MAFADPTQFLSQFPAWLIVIIYAWTLIWKSLALWKSARSSQPVWFIILFLVNTLGILEILYLFVFSKMKFDHLAAKGKSKKK